MAEDEQQEEPVETKLLREALYKLLGQPTDKDKLDTVATDLRHISEDLETLRQSWRQLEDDLFGL